MEALQLWPQMLGVAAPVLPQPWAVRLVFPLGWGLVLAFLFVRLARGRSFGLQVGAALAGLCLGWLPGSWSATYWLGLAFQSPSLTTMTLCAAAVWRQIRSASRGAVTDSGEPGNVILVYSCAALALGYLLVVDTFALLPVGLYAWGFGPAASLMVGVAASLPWLAARRAHIDPVILILPGVLLLFVLTRLPTGNVLDAVLDPGLWLALHLVLFRRLYRHYRKF
jgi:hypothetical protein